VRTGAARGCELLVGLRDVTALTRPLRYFGGRPTRETFGTIG
jgi:hypothetical protein